MSRVRAGAWAHHGHVGDEGNERYQRLPPLLAPVGALGLVLVRAEVPLAAAARRGEANGDQHKLPDQRHRQAPVRGSLAGGDVEPEHRHVLVHPQQRLVGEQQRDEPGRHAAQPAAKFARAQGGGHGQERKRAGRASEVFSCARPDRQVPLHAAVALHVWGCVVCRRSLPRRGSTAAAVQKVDPDPVRHEASRRSRE